MHRIFFFPFGGSIAPENGSKKKMYRASIAARARRGAYIGDYRSCAKLFEMYTADVLSQLHGVKFVLWEDLDPAIKEARGMSRSDTGVDVTDGATCIVQCKLRTGSLTYEDVGTFFGCALADPDGDGGAVSQWPKLLIARNACCKLSRHLAGYLRTRRWDLPLPMPAFYEYVGDCIATEPLAPLAPLAPAPVVLRDYQIEAIDLCADLTTAGPAYIVLPTGTGKSAIIVHSVLRVLRADHTARAIIFVPFINLMEQTAATFREHEVDIDCVGGGCARNLGARVAICVFNSAHLVDVADYAIQLIDEAHVACCPLVYRQHEERAAADASNARDPDASSTGYAAVRAVAALPTARLLSATLDIPDGAVAAPRVTRELRAMIEARILTDYQLHIPLFRRGTRDSTIARHLADNYQSLLVFAPRRATGLAFCAELNALAPGVRFIDCDTPAEERRETLELFKAGVVWCVVSVRTLAIGFDAPITTAVCFLHMPSSATFAVQVVGRALRLHPGKRMAFVVLPLVCGDDERGDSNDQCAARARDFMRILAHVDTRFALALRRRGVGYVDVSVVEDEGVEGAEGAEAAAERAGDVADGAELLRMDIFDSMGRAVRGLWETSRDALVQYRAANDGRYPPRAGPFAWLSNWTHNQRKARYTMSEEQRGALGEIGFCWNVRDESWERSLFKLAAHRATHGALPVQSTECGMWATTQRYRKRIGTLRADRVLKLEAIPGWTWDPHEAAWQETYAELCALGGTPAASSRLTQWACIQRRFRATMGADHVEKLEALPGWTWDPREAIWQEKYAELSSLGSMPPGSSRLYPWVRYQLTHRATLSVEHIEQLQALAFWRWPDEPR